MAGDFSITATLKQQDIDSLLNAGLNVTVLLDLSHNAHTTTTQHPSGLRVISKAIELDVSIGRGSVDDHKWANLTHAPQNSAAFAIYKEITHRGGISVLNHNNIKVEVPSFDKTIFDTAHVPSNVEPAYRAATAANAQNFNSLSTQDRTSMGMYQRGTDNQHFQISGQRETQSRTAP